MSASAEHLPDLPLIAHWIDGKPALAPGSGTSEVYDPSIGAAVARVAFASAPEVTACIQAAQAALVAWRRTPPPRRARVLFRFRQLVESATEELAQLISREHGKTVSDARGEIARGLEVIEFACGIPELLKGAHSNEVGTGVDVFSVREPLGVVVGITPFNFPVMVPLWMFPIAIACGNTFILKPSERDPSAALRLAELLAEAGLPNGVFNVLQGDRHTVDLLLEHPDIAAISFVGSTPVARHIHQKGTALGKRVQALGGAKNHMVVMPDADLDSAVSALLGAAYGSAGERCMAISVAIAVGDETSARLIERLTPRIQALRVGAPTDGETEMGPLVTGEHRARVSAHIESGVQEGATLLIDGRSSPAARGRGFFLGPSLFDHVRPEMKIYREEIFGPVLGIVRVPDLDSAIRLINAHSYANGTAIFTRSGSAARAFTSAVEVGMVGVNIPLPVPAAFHSFGGWRSSLFGEHHVYGHEGVRFYTRLKAVTQQWPRDSQQRADFSMPTTQ